MVIRMKKAMCLLLTLLFSLSLVPEAFAANINGVITPFYDYTNTTKTDLYISPNGLATATGSVTGYQGKTTKINMYLYLQRYDGINWVDTDNWSKSDENYRLTLTSTSYVSKGYTYRIKAYYYVYSGTDYESIIRYSNNISY